MTIWLILDDAAKAAGISRKDMRAHATNGIVEWRRGQGGKMEIAERDIWRINPPIVAPSALPVRHVTVRQVHQHLEQWLTAGTGDHGIPDFAAEVIWEAAPIVSSDLYVLTYDHGVVLRVTPEGRNCWEFTKTSDEIVVTLDAAGVYILGRGTLSHALSEVNGRAQYCGANVSQMFKPD